MCELTTCLGFSHPPIVLHQSVIYCNTHVMRLRIYPKWVNGGIMSGDAHLRRTTCLCELTTCLWINKSVTHPMFFIRVVSTVTPT